VGALNDKAATRNLLAGSSVHLSRSAPPARLPTFWHVMVRFRVDGEAEKALAGQWQERYNFALERYRNYDLA
jgi:hypothetical protein